MTSTITEALAEVKTVQKRIEKKREFILQFLARQDGVKDPLGKTGGAVEALKGERQSIADLEDRIVAIRRGIQKANEATSVTIKGVTRSIANWLVWRREIASGQGGFLRQMSSNISGLRDNAMRDGVAVVSAIATTADQKPTDFVVNIDEMALAEEIEALEDTLGQLDGQLSLKNATVAFE